MLIKCLIVGRLETNCYVVTNEKTLQCVVIDPGDEANTIMDYVESNNLKVCDIFLTHGHFDHTMASYAVSHETGAPVWINKKDCVTDGQKDLYKYFPTDATKFYSDGDEIVSAGLTFRVMETPGHSQGSVMLFCEDAIFSGDTIFRMSVGRTDLPGGNMDELMKSLKKIGSTVTADYEIYPGHMDATTMENERRFNEYLRYAGGIE